MPGGPEIGAPSRNSLTPPFFRILLDSQHGELLTSCRARFGKQPGRGPGCVGNRLGLQAERAAALDLDKSEKSSLSQINVVLFCERARERALSHAFFAHEEDVADRIVLASIQIRESPESSDCVDLPYDVNKAACLTGVIHSVFPSFYAYYLLSFTRNMQPKGNLQEENLFSK